LESVPLVVLLYQSFRPLPACLAGAKVGGYTRPQSPPFLSGFAAYGGELPAWTNASASQGHAPKEAATLAIAWDKAREQLGWRPRWALPMAVARTARWYRGFAQGRSAIALVREDLAAFARGA
jgi:hypothetical protein